MRGRGPSIVLLALVVAGCVAPSGSPTPSSLPPPGQHATSTSTPPAPFVLVSATPTAPPPHETSPLPSAPHDALASGTPRMISSVRGFLGTTGGGPDMSVAAGRGIVVALSYNDIGLFLKDGTLTTRVPISEFFRSVLPSDQGTTDPRVTYDYLSGRFFVVVATGAFGVGSEGCTPDHCPNLWLLAVSKSDDPSTLSSSDWYEWAFDARTIAGRPADIWGDFNVAAFTQDAVVISGQMVHELPQPTAVCPRLWIFNKTDLTSGRPLGGPRREICDLRDPVTQSLLTFRVLPAIQVDDPDGLFFVYSQGNCDIIVGKLTGSVENASTLLRTVHRDGLQCGEQLQIPQRGGGVPIEIHPHISSSPVFVNGSLWVTQVVATQAPSGRVDGIRIARLDVREWPAPPKIAEDLTIFANATLYGTPAIAAARSGGVALVMDVVNSSAYPGAAYLGRLPEDGNGTFRAPVLFRPGLSYFDYPGSAGDHINGGDYWGAAVDPVDGTAWFVGEFPARPCVWGVQLVHIAFEEGGAPVAPPEPPSAGGTAPCASGVTGSPYDAS